jgi:hypothetical protein
MGPRRQCNGCWRVARDPELHHLEWSCARSCAWLCVSCSCLNALVDWLGLLERYTMISWIGRHHYTSQDLDYGVASVGPRVDDLKIWAVSEELSLRQRCAKANRSMTMRGLLPALLSGLVLRVDRHGRSALSTWK